MPDSVLTILTPMLSELERALTAVLAVGYGQVTLHVEEGAIQRVVFQCSLKRQGLTTTTSCGMVNTDNQN